MLMYKPLITYPTPSYHLGEGWKAIVESYNASLATCWRYIAPDDNHSSAITTYCTEVQDGATV